MAAGLALAATAGAEAPVAVDDYLVAAENHVLEFDEADLLANDSDGGDPSLTLVVLAQPGAGTLEHHESALVYTPDDGFFGEDSFTYELIAGAWTSEVATVRLQVSPLILPFAGDWIGPDGQPVARNPSHVADIGWFNSADGYFVFIRIDDQFDTTLVEHWSPPLKCLGWLPVAGDWNADGIDDVGLLDPARREFHLWERKPDGGWTGRPAFQVPLAGQGGWPLAGDWSAGAGTEVGLYLPEEGRFVLLAANQQGAGVNDFVFELEIQDLWLPVAGRWNPVPTGGDTVARYGSQGGYLEMRFSNQAGGADQVWSSDLSPGAKPFVGEWGNGESVGFYDPTANLFVVYTLLGYPAGGTPYFPPLPPPVDPLGVPPSKP